MLRQELKKLLLAGYVAYVEIQSAAEGRRKESIYPDSTKEPTGSFRDFIMSEVRYSSLQRTFPEIAEEMFVKNEEDAKERLAGYIRMAAE